MKFNKSKVFLRYLNLILINKKLLFISLILILINSSLTIVLPKIIMNIIDNALPQKEMTLLFKLILIFLCIAISQCLFKLLSDYFCSILGQKTMFELKNRLMTHILKLDGNYYSNIKVGELLTIIDSDIYTLEQVSTNVLFSLISDSITAIIIFVFLIRLQYDLVIAILFLQVFLLLFQLFSCKNIISKKQNYRKSLGDLANSEEETISNLKHIILLNSKKYFLNKFNIEIYKLYKKGIATDLSLSINSNITSLLSCLTTSIILAFGGYKIILNQMELGELIAFNMYAQRIFTPIIRQIQSNLIIQQAIISLNRIFNILDLPISIQDNMNTEKQADNIVGKIDFKNVTFSYNNKTTVLNKINLKITPLDTIAIIGESGNGKTTLINLLVRLWQPNSGEILIDDKNINSYSLEFLRDNISVVSQDNFIFNDTIYNNLTLGKKDISMDKIIDICKKACIHDFIMSLPEQYNTTVGYRGDTLSGGQKQRLCIARAFLKKSSIIILDEITSALDKDLQEEILENLSLEFQKRTCIFITHRLSLLKYIDKVFLLDKGHIKQINNDLNKTMLRSKNDELYLTN